jgi:hypothetical protein
MMLENRERECLIKPLPNGREISVFRILGGRARVGIGAAGSQWIDNVW